MGQRLILFAKAPAPGRVKSRLVPALGSHGALALYEAFLHDQIRFLRSLSGPNRSAEICTDDPGKLPGYADGLPHTDQGPGDLGARLLRALERSHAEGASATVILGVDSPTLPASHVLEALCRLEEAPVVVSPADDGGYVLIGLRRPEPALFREVPWGGRDVLQVTRDRAREAGCSLSLLPGWYDVDDLAGLEHLRAEMAQPGTAERAPRTARFLFRLDGARAGVL